MTIMKRVLKLLAVFPILAMSVNAATPINLRVVWTESPQTKAVVAWDSIGKGDHVMVLSFSKDKIDYFTEELGKGKSDSATFTARKR